MHTSKQAFSQEGKTDLNKWVFYTNMKVAKLHHDILERYCVYEGKWNYSHISVTKSIVYILFFYQHKNLLQNLLYIQRKYKETSQAELIT